MLGAEDAAVIREAVDTGWVVFHSDEVAAGDKRAMAAIARSLGKESDRDGGALWPITPRARTGTFSITAQETGLHTDAQYHDQPEPRFLLFCVVPAACGGGANRLLRASDVIRRLNDAATLAEADTERLRTEAWSWEVPEIFQTAPMHNSHAVLGGGDTVRWRHDNLRPGGPEQARTAQRFRDYVETHPAVVDVRLDSGDVLYCDNKRVLHGRTAFQDPRRLLYRTRLW
ncbi:MAG TPA: TauD/TfdA family dioxygenase [Pseudonocardiaceae bacterium]